SKAALDYLADSLRADLASEGIAVSLISPGFVQTPLTDRNDFPMPFRISADDAARRMAQGLAAGRNRIHFPKRFTWTLKALACLPPPVRDRLAARLSRNSTP
ncbi:MAG: short-chain dehydrogenase, partial [Gammaproteobacteria bacterium]|nr:short-chain dehydrogenase [Gammaproteobacteria bacterium]